MGKNASTTCPLPEGNPLLQRNRDYKSMDTGLALTLISLLAYQLFPGRVIVTIATVLLLLCMAFPVIFAPITRIWLALADFLATAASALLLTLVFFLLVTPVGVVRQLLGSDPLKLKAWHMGKETLFTTRNHRWLPADMEKPY